MKSWICFTDKKVCKGYTLVTVIQCQYSMEPFAYDVSMSSSTITECVPKAVMTNLDETSVAW